MALDPIYGEVTVLTPAEQQARGLLPPGPLNPVGMGSPAAPQPAYSGTPAIGVEGFQAESTSRLSRASAAVAPLGMGLVGTALGGPLAGAGFAGATQGLLSKSPGAGVMEGAGWMLGGLAGKAVGKGVGALTRTQALQRFGETIEKNAVKYLQARVPAWKKMTSLTEMFHGQDALSAAYDASLKQVVAKGQTVGVPMRIEDMLKLGIEPATGTAPAGMFSGGSPMGLANAASVAEKMTGKWKQFPDVYRRAAAALDAAGVGDAAARGAYRTGSGAIEYLNATKSLAGETLNLEKAMGGLMNTKTWNMLRRRGMQDFAQILRGGEAEPVKKAVAGPLAKAAGGLGGFMGGMPVGHPFLGYHAGRSAVEAAAGGMRGVPPLPGVQRTQEIAPWAGRFLGGLGAGQMSS